MDDIQEVNPIDKQWKNTDNLKPWKPGQSGNPAGRPKEKTIKEQIRKYLEDNPTEGDRFMMDLIKKYQPLTWQMLEGKPAQGLEISGNLDLPFIVKIVKDDRGTTETTGIGG